MFLEPFVTKNAQMPSSSTQSKRSSTRLTKSQTFDDVRAQDPSSKSSTNRHSTGIRQRIRRELSGSLLDLSGRQSNQSQAMDPHSHPENDVAVAFEPQIDIEQAISLLQELKKTATPDELVALHRALLPTREVVATQKSPIIGQNDTSIMPRISRRMTTIPPGLATRAGIDVDFLRRPEDAIAQKQRRVSYQTGLPVPRINLTTVDMADDTSSMAGNQNTTPTESAYIHTGMYRHGTLRVMNGGDEASVVTGTSSSARPTDDDSPPKVALKLDTSRIGDSLYDQLKYTLEEQHEPKHAPEPPRKRPAKEERLHSRGHQPSVNRQDAETSRKRESSGQFAIVPAKWSDVPKSYPQMHSAEKHLSLGQDVDYETVSNPYEERRSADFQDWSNNGTNAKDRQSSNQARQAESQHVETFKLNRRMVWGDNDVDDTNSPTSVYETGNRPKSIHHPDSGYGSDAAPQNATKRRSRDPRFEGLPPMSFPDSPANEIPETPTESPTSARKSCILLRFQGTAAGRRKSVGTNAYDSADASPTSPIGPRKLQKQMPKSVIRQREAEMQRRQENRLSQLPLPDLETAQKPPSRPPPPPPHMSMEQSGEITDFDDKTERVSRKRSMSHGRERSNRADRFESKPSAIFRTRSKSLGRDLIRNPDRSMYDATRSRAAGMDKKLVGPGLFNRRSVAALQVFQHERNYQIQPGSVMAKAVGNFLSTSSPDLTRVRSEENSKSTLPSAEQQIRPSLRATKSYGNESKEPDYWKAGDPFVTTKQSPDPPLKQHASSGIESIPFGDRAAMREHLPQHRNYDQRIQAQTTPRTDFDFDLDQTGENDQQLQQDNQQRMEKHNQWNHHPQRLPIYTNDERNGGTEPVTGSQPPAQPFYSSNSDIPTEPPQNNDETPDWGSQAKLWRERRQAADAKLNPSPPKPPAHSSLPGTPVNPAPSSVSRLINESRMTGNYSPPPTGTASEQADAYRDLIMRSDENRPAKEDVFRTTSAQSTSTFYTVPSSYEYPTAAKPSGPRPPSSLSIIIPSTYQSPTTSRKASYESQNDHDPTDPSTYQSPPTSRKASYESQKDFNSTDPSPYIPYRPQNIVPTQSKHQPQPKPQPSRRPPQPPPPPQQQYQNQHQHQTPPSNGPEPVIVDRYGGGLAFNWDRKAGFRGSAGFRASNNHDGSRVENSRAGQKYGVDLSDVPVFLQRI